jgi:flagellar protein FlgJ
MADFSINDILSTQGTFASDNAKASALKGTLTNAASSGSDDELMLACKSFESYLSEQLINAMRATVPKSEDDENPYMQYFGDYLYREYAEKLTESGQLGLAQQLYDAMKLQSSGIIPSADG